MGMSNAILDAMDGLGQSTPLQKNAMGQYLRGDRTAGV